MARTHHLPAEERKERTVRAMVELCAEQDPARITTATIAERMKVTQGALFRHFSGKDEMWQAVVAWITERLMRRLEAAVDRRATPLTALEAMFMAHTDFIAEHPGVPRLIFGQLQHAEPTDATRLLRSMLAKYRERLAAILTEGRASGELRADLNIETAATQFIGTVQGLVVQSLIDDDVARIAEQAPEAFLLYRRAVQAREET
ncbi:MAG: TetR family transcriptional regulator [Halomonas sp.]|uniref:TetR/AcrR family transcriptional regulator n=1 Tax=Halomonas TaxID=2745 RepID=UPI0004893002|nr:MULTISPECIES: TetR family transcriptional regulator [Halomonas]NWN83558.1 TetR family transcriptional regulator [Halomonas sp.]